MAFLVDFTCKLCGTSLADGRRPDGVLFVDDEGMFCIGAFQLLPVLVLINVHG